MHMQAKSPKVEIAAMLPNQASYEICPNTAKRVLRYGTEYCTERSSAAKFKSCPDQPKSSPERFLRCMVQDIVQDAALLPNILCRIVYNVQLCCQRWFLSQMHSAACHGEKMKC